jgi:CHAT domain-containing protein
VAQVGSLGARTAVIYPIMLKDRLELLVGFEGGMKQVSVAVKAQDLIEAIRALRPLLERRTTRSYLPHAQRLYDYLLRPLEAELGAREIDTLVFVPDGALRTIPMSVLHDGRGFAIERYAIATTPGLTLTDPQPLLARKLNVLLNGLTLPVQGYSSLPNVGPELDSVQQMYSGTLLRDKDYLLGNLERELEKKSYNVVHIASHAQFRSDPKQTFLLTFDGKLTMDLLEKLIAPSRYREQPIELLALSACQTATGDDRAALGLAGVAIKAGARSALASLWFINDQSSTLLVSEFYRNLQGQNLSKAKALQQAQLKLLADSRFRHPGYWGPFLLIGNWL